MSGSASLNLNPNLYLNPKFEGIKNKSKIKSRLLLFLLLYLILVTPTASFAKEKHAELHVSGYGLAGNLELKRTLKTLDLRWKERKFFDANFVEDAALVILSRLERDGYLEPELDVELTLPGDRQMNFRWHRTIDPPLPRGIQVERAEFKIHKGLLYRYEQLEIRGSKELSEKEAKAFFVEKGVLLPLKKTRVFTPQNLDRSVANVTEVLTRRGYEKPQVIATNMVRNDKTGEVSVTVEINEGPKTIVRSIREETFVSTNAQPIDVQTIQTNAPFSKLWQQDLTQSLRTTNFHRGYPDTKVTVTELKREPHDGVIGLDLLATVHTGELITLRDAKFEGLKKTKPSVVERQVHLKEGALLDRVEAEQARYRLAQLGVFDSVGMRYDRIDPHTRDVIYSLREGKEWNVSLLFGYGSYELARIGVELQQFNAFGRAHHSRLRAVESMKATSADYLYTMPQFIGEDVDVFLNANYLQREEIDFNREEFGGGAGAKTFFSNIQSDFSARYNYQVLSATEAQASIGPTNAAVGAVILELKHDQRDSPIYPRQGYKIMSSLEGASEYLGGDVSYLRFEMQGSYHHPISDGRWFHGGISHGVIGTLRNSARDLPFNKRFFPGGENSVRGFQYGEAAPRDSFGRIIGAETYTAGNFEFEQALTKKVSLVLFSDAIGFARDIADYPFDEYLVSVGLGFRWKTIIGPVRLEYGHNVLRRNDDPMGTLHFSIGFPF